MKWGNRILVMECKLIHFSAKNKILRKDLWIPVPYYIANTQQMPLLLLPSKH